MRTQQEAPPAAVAPPAEPPPPPPPPPAAADTVLLDRVQVTEPEPLPEQPAEQHLAPEADASPAPLPLGVEISAIATLSGMAVWLAEGAALAGEPLSLTTNSLTRDARVNVADADQFHRWCAWLHIGRAAHRVPDRLGDSVCAAAQMWGWTVYVTLFGAAAQEVQ